MQHKKEEIFSGIINYVNDYVDEKGTSPSMNEIATGLGIAKSTVSKYAAYMCENGICEYDSHRRIRTKQMQQDLADLTRTPLRNAPVVGYVACGSPTEAEEYEEESVRLPASIFGQGPLFILHASGDSMIEAGIEDGDLVVVKQQSTANRGDIVVALTKDGTTLKGYYPEPQNRRIRLQPANSAMEPMYFEEVTIQGIATRVIKTIHGML